MIIHNKEQDIYFKVYNCYYKIRYTEEIEKLIEFNNIDKNNYILSPVYNSIHIPNTKLHKLYDIRFICFENTQYYFYSYLCNEEEFESLEPILNYYKLDYIKDVF